VTPESKLGITNRLSETTTHSLIAEEEKLQTDFLVVTYSFLLMFR